MRNETLQALPSILKNIIESDNVIILTSVTKKNMCCFEASQTDETAQMIASFLEKRPAIQAAVINILTKGKHPHVK